MRLATKTLERGDRKENKIDEVRPNLIFVFILFSHLILKLATEKVIIKKIGNDSDYRWTL